MQLGTSGVEAVMLGTEKLWPLGDGSADGIDLDALAAVLSCISSGSWLDIAGWKDDVAWGI